MTLMKQNFPGLGLTAGSDDWRRFYVRVASHETNSWRNKLATWRGYLGFRITRVAFGYG